MEAQRSLGFGGGIIIGILVGAVIDNMGLGLLLGLALGWGIIRLPGSKS